MTAPFYKMSVDRLRKVMKVQVVGAFDHELVQKFINEYQKNVNAINAADYTIELDCADMAVITQDMVPQMQACHEMYRDSGFNKVVFQIANPIVKVQMGRVARMAGLKSVEFVEMAKA